MAQLKADSGELVWVLYPCIAGTGLGILYTATMFVSRRGPIARPMTLAGRARSPADPLPHSPSQPTLAPLRPDQHPQAMSFYNFARSFGQVFGIAIGSTVLTNSLSSQLPSSFLATYGGSAEAAVPYIAALAEPVRTQVRVAYADALGWIWWVSLGVAGAGLVGTCGMTSMEMTGETDERWGLEGEGVVGVAAVALAVAGLERVEVEKPHVLGDDDAHEFSVRPNSPLAPPRALGRAGHGRSKSARFSVDLLAAIGARPAAMPAPANRMTMFESPRPAPRAGSLGGGGPPMRMSVLGMPAGGASGRVPGRSTSVDWRMSRV